MRKRLFGFLAILALTACTTPKTPSQAVYLAEGDFAAAVRIELAYDSLPRCTTPKATKICSDITIMRKVRKADDVAWAALQAAQAAVQTPGFGDNNIATAVASATALTTAFINITDTLKIK